MSRLMSVARSVLLSMVLTALPHSTALSAVPGFFKPRTSADRVFVFVHGIFGDALTTWRNAKGQYIWDLLDDEPGFRSANVYVYGFPSNFLTNSFSIDDAVSDLNTRLRSDDVFSHKQVIFVAHSMGGLVTETFLLRYRELAKMTPVIFLYSTPHEGSDISSIARWVSKNPGLETMIAGDKNQYLDRLERDWRAAKESADFLTEIRCAYETKNTYGVRIVSRLSATRPCVGDSVPVDADHIEIVKPIDKTSGAIVALRAVVKAIPAPPQPSISSANVDVQITPTASVPTAVTETLHVDDGSENCSIDVQRTANFTLRGGERITGWGVPSVSSSNCPSGASQPIAASIRRTGEKSLAIDYRLRGCGNGPLGIGCNGRGWIVFDLPIQGIQLTPNVPLASFTWSANGKSLDSGPIVVIYDKPIPPDTQNITWPYSVKLITSTRRGEQILEQRTITLTHTNPTSDGFTSIMSSGRLTISKQ